METNVKMTKLVRRVMTIAAAMLMVFTVFAAAVPAQAANTPVNGGTFTFNKYLVMDKSANVPVTEFTFKIEAGSEVDADDGNPAIYAGVMTGTTVPSVGKAAFAAGGTAFDTVQGDDSVVITGEKKYAKAAVAVDLTGISFTAPGIYRYVITENANGQDGIANDPVTTRTLDVVVAYDDAAAGTLKVTHYVLYRGTKTDATNEVEKDDGFTNTYATNNLTLEKKVTGNQGDRDKYFEFEVKIENAVPGTQYSIGGTYDVNAGEHTNPATTEKLTATDGSVTRNFYLKNGQNVIIMGLTEDTTYTITETSYANDGYVTSHTVDGAASGSGDPLTTDSKGMAGSNHTVTFTNHKEGTVPTGVLLEIAPYIALAVVVIAGFVVLFATRRRRER